MYFRYFNSKYRFVPALPGDWYLTSTSLLVIPSARLSVLLGQDQIFDIRIFAALSTLLYLLGIWLILVAARSLKVGTRIILAGMLVLIFTDVGYVAYFNSFYSEGTALVFLAIAIGCGLILIAGQSSRTVFLMGYFVSLGVLVTSKPMYVPMSPAFGLFGVYLSSYVRFPKRYLIASSLAVATCCVGVWYFQQTTPRLALACAYIGLFMDMLPNSDTPRQDLADLGLNPDYEAFSGTTPYDEDSPIKVNPQFRSEFTKQIKSYSLPLFYATHPTRFYNFCRRCMGHTFTTRVDRAGYYEATTGKPPFAKPFGLWSSIRENVFPRWLSFLAFYFGTGIAVLFGMRMSPLMRPYCLLYLLFVFMAASQFLIATTGGGGEPGLIRRLFMFNVAFDACFALFIVGGCRLVQWCWSHPRRNDLDCGR